MSSRALFAATFAVAVIAFCARPISYWEFDEPLFSQALHRYDPVAHHPPPPGYPLFIFVAKLVRFFAPSDLAALVSLSFIATTIAFALLAIAFGRIAGDATSGIAGALLFYLSPAMLVHSTLPISEPGALALLAAALFFAAGGGQAILPVPASDTDRQDCLSSTFLALTVGWRPQFSIFVVPLLFAVLFVGPPPPAASRRRRPYIALAVFTAVCLAWLIPLTMAVGGVEKLIAFESGQAQYLAAHDAEASRQGWSAAAILIHFIAHPWGPRVMALPLLIAAAFGAWQMRRARLAIALGSAGAIYLIVALAVMDPADGVRYAIPFLLVAAFAAGVGAVAIARRMAAWPYAPVVAFSIGSIVYVSSFVAQRASIPSPVTRAVDALPRGTAVGYELSLWPHATYFYGNRAFRIDHSMQRMFDRPDVPLFAFLNGTTELPGARTFSWENSDAYWNLTRNLYRVVSVAPIGPERRYRVLRGMHLMEREADAIRRVTRAETSTEIWRWLDADVALEIPRATGVEMRLLLPKTFPHPDNSVTVLADGHVVGVAHLRRGEELRFTAEFPSPARLLELHAARAIIPEKDRRRVAVQLRDLVFRGTVHAWSAIKAQG